MEPMRLLCVVGMSPAIVTETVWALLCGQEARDVKLVEIVVATTSKGARECDKLLEKLDQLARDWPEAAPSLNGVVVRVEVVKDETGAPLHDLRTSQDNIQFELLLRGLIYQFTQREEPRLHASLAGGRKTMSYYMGSLMSLFARDQDGMSHVLVGQDWAEQAKPPGFWYPLPASCDEARAIITTYGGTTHRASEATVELFEVPLIRLRILLGGKLDNHNIKKYSFDDLIRLAQHGVDPGPTVVVYRTDWSIHVDDSELTGLSPTEHTILARALLLHRSLRGERFEALELCAIGAGDALDVIRKTRQQALKAQESTSRGDTESAKWAQRITLFDEDSWPSPDKDARDDALARINRTRTEIADELRKRSERYERWLSIPNAKRGTGTLTLRLPWEHIEIIDG
jgi:CRISPR-associated protein (TIGR02584 family)